MNHTKPSVSLQTTLKIKEEQTANPRPFMGKIVRNKLSEVKQMTTVMCQQSEAQNFKGTIANIPSSGQITNHRFS